MNINITKYLEERQLYFVPELCSRIIESMITDGTVTLRTKEPKSGHLNGLFVLLEQLCDHWHWDPSKITLETPNEQEYHDRFNIIHTLSENLTIIVGDKIFDIKHRPWNKQYVYGMFIGRANLTRLHGAHKHLNFEFQHLGLTSFNQDVNYFIDHHDLLDYLAHTDQTYQQALNIKPYSDIGDIIQPPIVPPINILGWEDVYEKIGIELVFETSQTSWCHQHSEKLYRPIFYKRPFMVIAGAGYLKNLTQRPKTSLKPLTGSPKETKEFLDYYQANRKPLRVFNQYITTEYDNDEGVHRVDHVFDILRELIKTEKIYRILEDCAEDIEYNYEVMKEEYKMLANATKGLEHLIFT